MLMNPAWQEQYESFREMRNPYHKRFGVLSTEIIVHETCDKWIHYASFPSKEVKKELEFEFGLCELYQDLEDERTLELYFGALPSEADPL